MLYSVTRSERILPGPQVERDFETDRAGAVKREELALATWDTLKNWTAPPILHRRWSFFRLGSTQNCHENNLLIEQPKIRIELANRLLNFVNPL